jgi:hypothetical protein
MPPSSSNETGAISDRMTKTPKRRSFQIHLSTMVILLLVCGVLGFLNRPQTINEFVYKFGWPREVRVLQGMNQAHLSSSNPDDPNDVIVLDCIWGLLITGATVIVCEWVIRQSRRN